MYKVEINVKIIVAFLYMSVEFHDDRDHDADQRTVFDDRTSKNCNSIWSIGDLCHYSLVAGFSTIHHQHSPGNFFVTVLC